MLDFVGNILYRLFLAFILSMPWTLFSFFIIHGLACIKKEEDDVDNKYGDIFTYLFFANMILIFVGLLYIIPDSEL